MRILFHGASVTEQGGYSLDMSHFADISKLLDPNLVGFKKMSSSDVQFTNEKYRISI